MDEAAQSKELDLQLKKAKCIREAMSEVLSEQKREVIKRTVAKLKALGVEISPEEIGL